MSLFFFKQKTAYEMRISDWSSDVCSSDLRLVVEDARTGIQRVVRAILASLLKNPPEGWVVEPIHANAGELGYRYARSFADRFLGLEHHWHEDRPVDRKSTRLNSSH